MSWPEQVERSGVWILRERAPMSSRGRRSWPNGPESIVISSGATDVITDGERTFLVDNGHNMMGSISVRVVWPRPSSHLS